ncbi:MAG: GTP-binding protein, partial [Halorhodospira sp.]
MNAPVPTNLITAGFLGSGKTTVIRHLLATARPRDERWAVLINESLEALRGCQRVKGVLRTGPDWLRVDADRDGVRATAAA